MKTEIDRVLVQQIISSKGRPRNFIFAHGSKESVLVIDKKPIGMDKVKAAQKRADNTRIHRGQCFLESAGDGGKTMVFFVKKPEETLERHLRKALKENAGLNYKVDLRVPTDNMFVGGEIAQITDE